MALTAPIAVPSPRLVTEDVQVPDIVVHGDDLKRVRLYCRLAAAIPAAAVVLLALLVVRLPIQFLDGRWSFGQTLIPLAVAIVAGAVLYLRAELRLRSYHLDLIPAAVVFEIGRKRSYVPREHIQLFDSESSILLRLFGLRRCNLHTSGGTVVVSPAPARVASAIERMIFAPPAIAPPDRTDDDS